MPRIRGIIRNRRLTRPSEKNKVPPWDVAVVLRYLSGAPFEPREGASFSDITLKALFLLVLASGKRRGELHALSRDGLSWNRNRTVVFCGFDPHFISKTQPSTGVAMSSLEVRALSNFVGSEEPDELVLCPVRALLYYYERARKEGLVGTRKRLFISALAGKVSDISSATIIRWIKKLIIKAHKVVSDRDLRLSEVKAHQVRAVAVSLAFKSATLDQVLEMGGWINASTFTEYYLVDTATQNESRYSLGPFIYHPCF